MSKKPGCVICGISKGKRICPEVNGGNICPSCCGTNRRWTIDCPTDCDHLKHEIYQAEKRFVNAIKNGGKEYIAKRMRDIQDRRILDYIVNIECFIHVLHHYRGLQERDIVPNLADAINRFSTIIILSSNPTKPAFGKDIYERAICYESHNLSTDDKKNGLKQVLHYISEAQKDSLNYFDLINNFFSEIIDPKFIQRLRS